MSQNILYYGDNLDILRRYIKDESVDLIYLDPPFKSDQDYNVLFAEKNGSQSKAQIKVFEDTWYWDQGAAEAFQDVVENAPHRVSQVMQAFRLAIGENDLLAYLSMMAPRLLEMRRALKSTGSLYLHCDPTASHYLKLLMDAIFGPVNFRNEITWKRAQPKSHTRLRMSRTHDILLFYAKSEAAKYKRQYKAHDPAYVEKFYKYVEEGTGRRYRLGDLTNPNKNRPHLTYEFPQGSGVVRVWRWTKERMMQAWNEGRVVKPPKGEVVCYKRYLDEMEGEPITDVWTDIEHLHGSQQEALGYPTQKPEALLERIIDASSNEGDIVMDPFCGCGTAVIAAQRLNRRWIGIDITHLAITLIKHRLLDVFGPDVEYEVVGEPVSITDGETLASADTHQFQIWALGLVGARPVEMRKGPDKGIDGRIFFHDDIKTRETKQIILQVKSGHVSVRDIRDLIGVINREKAEIGVFITLTQPTRPMRSEAASAGFYESSWGRHPKVQILTVAELLEGKRINYPPSGQVGVTFKKAPKARIKKPENYELKFGQPTES